MAEQKQQLNIKASDADLKGNYANVVSVAHTPEEFVMDFMLVHPPAGELVSRVIVSPGHMKRFVKALKENLQKYENQFGEVKTAEGPKQEFGFTV